jgi:hypothetical protein
LDKMYQGQFRTIELRENLAGLRKSINALHARLHPPSA